MRFSDVLLPLAVCFFGAARALWDYDYYQQSTPLVLTLEQVQEAFDVSAAEYNMSRPFPTFPTDGPKFTPALRHQRNRRAHPDARMLDQAQRSFERALLLLTQWYQVSLKDVQTAVSQLDLTLLEPVAMWRDLCLRLYPDTCDASEPYRSLDGSCNNLGRPSWGKALTCHARMSEPVYANGINTPRSYGASGNPLPNPREVSIAIRNSPPDPRYRRTHTHLFMAYGQLIDHDITLSPDARGANGSLLMCCGERASPACFPIRLPINDPFFSPLGIDCLNVVRTSSCTDCSGFHERRIVNQQSSFLDASLVYGTADETLNTLRDPAQPEHLLMPMGILPPSLNPDDDGCSDPATSQFCFRAGDPRVNQQPGIASLTILYAKQHNRIATELNRLFPWWDKETVFQETRRVLIAQHQHIVYTEYIPQMLGPLHTAAAGLGPRLDPITGKLARSQYEPDRDPRIMVEFTTAAFRFGHGLIDHFSLVNCRGGVTPFSLSDRFFQVQDFYRPGLWVKFMRGLILQPGRPAGSALSDSVRSHLYRNQSSQAGLDLASINVQRGRDHGIPGYGHWLRRCLGRHMTNFEDLTPYVPPENIEIMRSLWEHPDDVDLWAAGLMEYPAGPDALVGPTFACILGRQFRSLKFADRFFYTHGSGSNVNALTDTQVAEISKFSLAKMICANADDPDTFWVQPQVFLQPDEQTNPLMLCKDIPDTDLSSWVPAVRPQTSQNLQSQDYLGSWLDQAMWGSIFKRR